MVCCRGLRKNCLSLWVRAPHTMHIFDCVFIENIFLKHFENNTVRIRICFLNLGGATHRSKWDIFSSGHSNHTITSLEKRFFGLENFTFYLKPKSFPVLCPLFHKDVYGKVLRWSEWKSTATAFFPLPIALQSVSKCIAVTKKCLSTENNTTMVQATRPKSPNYLQCRVLGSLNCSFWVFTP